MPRLRAGQAPRWRRFLDERLSAVQSRKPRSIVDVQDWVVLFLHHLLVLGYQPSTIAAYHYMLGSFVRWCHDHGHHLVRRLRRDHIIAYLRYRLDVLGATRSTVPFDRQRLRVFFSFLLAQDVLHGSNPAAGIGFYRRDRRRPREILTHEECLRLVRAPLDRLQEVIKQGDLPSRLERVRAYRDAAILGLMVGSGLRRTEIAELPLEGLILDEAICRVQGKGRQRLFRRERDAFIHESTLVPLREYLALTGDRNAGVAFLTLDAQPISPSTVGHIPGRYAKGAIGRRVTAHLLRHSFATHLIQRGADPHSAQRLLGHKDVATTLHYYLHLTAKEVRDAWRAACPVKGRHP